MKCNALSGKVSHRDSWEMAGKHQKKTDFEMGEKMLIHWEAKGREPENS
jgi:hypothetical protein